MAGTIGSVNQLPSLVIPSGQTSSNVLGASVTGDAIALLVYSPSTLDATTFVFQVNPARAATSASSGWCTLRDSSGTAIAAAVVDSARLVAELVHAGAVRILAGAATAASRTFAVTGVKTS